MNTINCIPETEAITSIMSNKYIKKRSRRNKKYRKRVHIRRFNPFMGLNLSKEAFQLLVANEKSTPKSINEIPVITIE